LVAALGLLVLIGPSSGAVAAATFSSAVTSAAYAQTASCFPLSESSGTCYYAGEFCPEADVNKYGVAANGTSIACEVESGEQQPKWETCTPVTFATTATSTETAALTCPVAPAGTAAAGSTPTGASTTTPVTPTTSAPAGAPATGGGTGPWAGAVLAATGSTVMVGGAGLIFLTWRRRRAAVSQANARSRGVASP
jgi:hypothetical protein